MTHTRMLVIVCDDDDALSISESSDDFAPWQLIGISAWLDLSARDALIEVESEETDTD